MINRFDHRSEEQFKKDIFFGTQIEKYFFQRFLKQPQIEVIEWKDNGVCNEGSFIKKGRTSGTDYKATFKYKGKHYIDQPLEVKWVPTRGKLTMKIGDMKTYIRDKVNILFIFNTSDFSLRSPADKDLKKHISQIESIADQIQWGILFSDKLEVLTNSYETKPISYMGNKPGFVVPEEHYHLWMDLEQWN